MSESAGGTLDAKQLIHVPGWVKLIVFSVIATMLFLSVSSSIYFLYHHTGSEEIVYSLFMAQASTTALVLIVILSYSSRDENMDGLIKRSDQFIEAHVPKALQRISVPDRRVDSFNVSVIGKKDIFGRAFYLQHDQISLKMWVGLNVNRIFVVYFVENDGRENFSERVKDIFRFTFGGAVEVGFSPKYESFERAGKRYLSIWMTAVGEKDLLTAPTEKLFWSQDIAMMTESFVRTASRHGLLIDPGILPGPL